MGRDVGRDEGREQAEWRDLVARLELQAPVDPADAPWPERENLRAKTQPGTAGATGSGSGDPAGSTPAGSTTPGSDPAGSATADAAENAAQDIAVGPADSDADPGDPDAKGNASHGSGHRRSGSADRSRVIRPAGSTRFRGPAADPSAKASADADPDLGTPRLSGSTGESGNLAEPARAAGDGGPALGGPRDYEVDEPRDEDLDELWDDRYIPPSLPPQPMLDSVAKGAWLALFGGPGYLLVATLLNWQIPGWAALAAVIAFVTGFVVLVFRLGDGPSKRDGPDQGAVV